MDRELAFKKTYFDKTHFDKTHFDKTHFDIAASHSFQFFCAAYCKKALSGQFEELAEIISKNADLLIATEGFFYHRTAHLSDPI